QGAEVADLGDVRHLVLGDQAANIEQIHLAATRVGDGPLPFGMAPAMEKVDSPPPDASEVLERLLQRLGQLLVMARVDRRPDVGISSWSSINQSLPAASDLPSPAWRWRPGLPRPRLVFCVSQALSRVALREVRTSYRKESSPGASAPGRSEGTNRAPSHISHPRWLGSGPGR